MNLRWRACKMALAPRGVIARGETSRALWRLARARDAASRARWEVTAHDEILIITSEEPLPWLEGVRYIAPTADAPDLWLPTNERPDVPLDLLAMALRARFVERPLLLLRNPDALVPLHRLLPASDAVLDRIATSWAAG